MLMLRRTLAVGTRKTKQVVGKNSIPGSRIRRSAVNKEFAVDIKVEQLIKTLPAHIPAELQRVGPNNFADAVAPLKRISHLRQFPLAVVTDIEPATQLNERKALVLRTEVGMDAERVGLRAV